MTPDETLPVSAEGDRDRSLRTLEVTKDLISRFVSKVDAQTGVIMTSIRVY